MSTRLTHQDNKGFKQIKRQRKELKLFVQVKYAFLENSRLFKSAMYSSLGASIAYSRSEKGVGKPHEAKMLFVPWRAGYALEGSMCGLNQQMRF